MIDVVSSAFAIENYAQVGVAGGSWMEWDARRRRDTEDWPPPRPPDPPGLLWGEDDPWHDDPWHDHWQGEEDDLGDCDCGGPPPPLFNIPPPPPLPPLPLDDNGEGEEECAAPPSEVCPALLVAGDAHTRQQLQPPLAALVVAAATFTLVVIIAALVYWRYRRQQGRRGPGKSSSDLTNGVIYEDLPSGPAPRIVPAAPHAHGPHDTHTLAPMELLDLKVSHSHSTYGCVEGGTPALLHQPLSPDLTPARVSPQYSPRHYHLAQDLYNPTYEEISTGSDSTSVSSGSVVSSEGPAPQPSLERVSEGPGSAPPGTWSENGSCTCPGRRSGQGKRGGRGRKTRAASSATSTGTTEGSEYHEALLPQLLSGVPRHAPRHAPRPYTIQGTSDGRTSTSSSSDLPVDRSLAPREPRYYVGVPPPPTRSPITPDGPIRGPSGLLYSGDSVEGSSGTSTCGGERPSPTERGLPPLPSRSDRYRIYFSTERRRAAEGAPRPAAARTLDPAARKRQRRHDSSGTRESEPLYHEL